MSSNSSICHLLSVYISYQNSEIVWCSVLDNWIVHYVTLLCLQVWRSLLHRCESVFQLPVVCWTLHLREETLHVGLTHTHTRTLWWFPLVPLIACIWPHTHHIINIVILCVEIENTLFYLLLLNILHPVFSLYAKLTNKRLTLWGPEFGPQMVQCGDDTGPVP